MEGRSTTLMKLGLLAIVSYAFAVAAADVAPDTGRIREQLAGKQSTVTVTIPEPPCLEIQVAADPTALIYLAAHETRRYIYLRTDELLPVVTGPAKPGGIIVIACKNDATILANSHAELRAKARNLGEQQFLLRTINSGSSKTLWIVGGDPQGALYGTYRYLETLGLRFYLHADVVPDCG